MIKLSHGVKYGIIPAIVFTLIGCSHWLLCFPLAWIAGRDNCGAYISEICYYIKDSGYPVDTAMIENDNETFKLKIPKTQKSNYAVVYGSCYNRKDLIINCNNHEAAEYNFEVNKQHSSIFNYPLPLIYNFSAKIYLQPGKNHLTMKIGNKRKESFEVHVIKLAKKYED